MDINDLRGISTAFLLVVFVGLVFWAYSSKRKKSFDEAANLPFADDEADDVTDNSARQHAAETDKESHND